MAVNRPVKILMICTVKLDVNGITRWILNYSRKISSPGMDIHIVAPNIVDNAKMRDDILESGIHLYELPVRKENTLKYFLELIGLIRREKYDIVHVHGNSCTEGIELLAARIGGCRIRIAHSHNTTCQHQVTHMLLMRPLFEFSCTHRFACGENAGKWLFGRKPFEIIPNSVDLEKYRFDAGKREQMRKRLGIEKEVKLLGHIGTFNYQKNQEFLVELLNELLYKYHENCRLIFLGDGEEKASVEKLAEERNLSHSILFEGQVGEVENYLQAMDCFLLPSRFEGLPYVAIEAQAAGLPVLMSNNISKETMIGKNVQFLPIDEGTGKWAEAILRMDWSRQELPEQMKRFSLDYSARLLKEKYYNLALNGKNRYDGKKQYKKK